MAGKDYFVDWSDPVYPDIKHRSEAWYPEDCVTWSNAKDEIDEHFSNLISHYKSRRNYWRHKTKAEWQAQELARNSHEPVVAFRDMDSAR